MITVKDFPDKQFSSKEELFAELRKAEPVLIASKKAQVWESKNKVIGCSFLTKTSAEESKLGPHMKSGYIYPVINTTNYMDSHRDVHFNGIWNKSVKEQDGKIFYTSDHNLDLDKIIAWPEDVKVMVKSVPWSFVGKPYEGYTEALIYEIAEDKIVNQTAKDIIKEKRPVQNSVRMVYVKIRLAMNSSTEEDRLYKEYYEEKIGSIVNREHAEELGYFWGVEEAKIVLEGSMVVRGSNDATPVRSKHTEPSADTQKRAAKRTRINQELNNLLKQIKK